MIILSFRHENYRTWQMAPKEIKGEFFKQSQNAKRATGLKYQLVNCFIRTWFGQNGYFK
jgi:hypothetical protein